MGINSPVGLVFYYLQYNADKFLPEFGISTNSPVGLVFYNIMLTSFYLSLVSVSTPLLASCFTIYNIMLTSFYPSLVSVPTPLLALCSTI